jgi:hypothetical protein
LLLAWLTIKKGFLKRMRATRFPLSLAARYRPLGHEEWLQGRTCNVSASGVLVHAREPLQVDTRVEVQLALASGKAASPLGAVACLGRVVRVVPSSGSHLYAIAVAIEQYDFLQGAASVAHVERSSNT